MRWSKPHVLKLSTARQLSRFVKNPHHNARLSVRNCHRRPFACRGSATNRLKSHAGVRKMRRQEVRERSRNFRSEGVIGPALVMRHGV
jgi:hypothetical protein